MTPLPYRPPPRDDKLRPFQVLQNNIEICGIHKGDQDEKPRVRATQAFVVGRFILVYRQLAAGLECCIAALFRPGLEIRPDPITVLVYRMMSNLVFIMFKNIKNPRTLITEKRNSITSGSLNTSILGSLYTAKTVTGAAIRPK